MSTYAQYISETAVNYRIPTSIDLDGVHYQGNLSNRPDILSALDYYEVVEAEGDQPEPQSGYHLEPRYAPPADGKIVCSYVEVADPPRNLSISKRKLMNALKGLGIWTQVKAFLETNDYWDDFDMATTLDEQEEMMQRAINALKTAFSLSEETIENIIVNSIAE